jgi:hypothetical protein
MSGRRALMVALAATLAAGQPAWAAEADPACAPKDLAALAGWSGVWVAEGVDAVSRGIGGQFGGNQEDYKLMGLSAPWNDEGWARMAAMLRLSNTPTVKLPIWGYPMMMDTFAEFKFVISPAETVIINQYREIRSVYTDGRGHMPEDERWATNWGDSTGCWEGDILVIDTVAVRYDPELSVFAPPLSEDAHFVERLRLVAPGRIENEVTITDPQYLTAPWKAQVTYHLAEGIDRLVQDAFEDRIDSDSQTIAPVREEFVPLPLPTSVRLSTAELDRLVGRYGLDGTPLELVLERRGDRLFFQPPGLADFIPMFAQGPLSFVSLDGGQFRFIADSSGRITGFEGTAQPGGTAETFTRKQP